MPKTLFKFILLLNLCLLVSQWWLTSLRATEGEDLSTIESKISQYREQNNHLQAEIYSFSATARIFESAPAFALSPAKVSFLNAAPVAAKPDSKP